LTISFENEHIRSVCEDESCALSHYEPDIVRKLQNRLADLEACVFLSEVGVGNITEITNDGFFCYKIDVLKNSVVLVFEPVPSNSKTQSIKLDSINRIKITEIRNLN